MVDSSFFWGYIVTQIPGGFLAARYPANRVFGSAIATSALLNMLLPIAAKAGFQYVMLLRILQGLVEVSLRSAQPLLIQRRENDEIGARASRGRLNPFPVANFRSAQVAKYLHSGQRATVDFRRNRRRHWLHPDWHEYRAGR